MQKAIKLSLRGRHRLVSNRLASTVSSGEPRSRYDAVIIGGGVYTLKRGELLFWVARTGQLSGVVAIESF